MPNARRITMLLSFAAALAVFRFGPGLLGLDAAGLLAWAAVAQVGGPLAAAIFSWFAARTGDARDRLAWLSFCAGSSLYFAGNLAYLGFTLAGQKLLFPSLPDAAYFLMAICFAAGLFQYGKLGRRVSAVQVANFVLIYCAITLASLFLLHRSIAESVLPPFATIAAFAYPALWFSVAASGLISLVLYDQGRRSVAFTLLILAVLAEAIADFGYSLELLGGTYQLGGWTQLLWVASAGLLTWAASEQIVLSRTPPAEPDQLIRRNGRSFAQATIPAAAVALILLSGSLTGALGQGSYAGFAAIIGMIFAVVAGFREYWIIHTQRRLRGAVEDSRADLMRSEERLSSVLESTSDSVLVLDLDWNVVFFNQRAATTINKSELLRNGISVWELFPAALTSGEGDHYKRAVATGQPAEFEIFVEDRRLWLGISAYPTADGLSIFFRDISERKRRRDEVMHLAHHDPLTGLANRLLFQRRLEEALTSGPRTAALLLDLDHFKEINDTLGHPVGDALLVATADRLRACLMPEDTIARLGGDEFAVIVAGFEGVDEIGILAQRIIDAACAVHVIEGQSVRIGASIGIALGTAGGEDSEQIFKNADIALYAAKSGARGGFRFFEPAMETELQQQRMLHADLRAALGNGEFALAYQPLVDLASERVCGFEALLRWTHPVRGPVSPEEFIPMAEETGLIVDIGAWVLRTACAEAARWPDDIWVAVNLSSRQFSAGDLPAMVEEVLGVSGLAATRLELEITETVLLGDSEANLETLRRLRDLGIRIALDDFGTGFSSLRYLQRFPFSKIKIDRSFIAGLPTSEESKAIVRSVIGLGRSLRMKVTAEGVETPAQLDWVKAGCDEAQGYHLSRPVAAALIPSVIAELDRRPLDLDRHRERWAS
ncbi:MAG: EAL domain-containing protein [Devosia nanyangense]|uniref:EAL domain-containing protein n=1 Tax=Devosia nanyangense TaxID=1228055 RepID=A0A933L5W8_9HYPH|nr:EAL domain-containing protein [Devosia nanyangense]